MVRVPNKSLDASVQQNAVCDDGDRNPNIPSPSPKLADAAQDVLAASTLLSVGVCSALWHAAPFNMGMPKITGRWIASRM